LVGGVAGVDGHVVVRVVDDVPLDARVRRPAVHADVRVLTAGARLGGGELRGDLPVGLVGAAVVTPLEADATEVVSGILPRRGERRDAVRRHRPGADVGPNLPGEVARAALTVARVLLCTLRRHGGVAVELGRHRAAAAAAG